MEETLWRGVTDPMEQEIVAKRVRDDAMDMDYSPEQQNQRQGPSGSKQFSPEPAEEEAGHNRSFALSGLFDGYGSEDDVSTRELTPVKNQNVLTSSARKGADGEAKLSHIGNNPDLTAVSRCS